MRTTLKESRVPDRRVGINAKFWFKKGIVTTAPSGSGNGFPVFEKMPVGFKRLLTAVFCSRAESSGAWSDKQQDLAARIDE